jgi:hypothetical protein
MVMLNNQRVYTRKRAHSYWFLGYLLTVVGEKSVLLGFNMFKPTCVLIEIHTF